MPIKSGLAHSNRRFCACRMFTDCPIGIPPASSYHLRSHRLHPALHTLQTTRSPSIIRPFSHTQSDMALATVTPSRARFDAPFPGTISRPEFHQTEGRSMADQLPSINFGFDDLRERMMQFTARFDEFIERGRKRVLEERNHFRLNVAEIQGT